MSANINDDARALMLRTKKVQIDTALSSITHAHELLSVLDAKVTDASKRLDNAIYEREDASDIIDASSDAIPSNFATISNTRQALKRIYEQLDPCAIFCAGDCLCDRDTNPAHMSAEELGFNAYICDMLDEID